MRRQADMEKWKIALVVIGLLATGFIAGFATNRLIVRSQIERVRDMENKGPFGEIFLDKIEATPEQRAAIRPVLDQYNERFRELIRTSRQQRRATADSLLQELTPLLAEEQLQELNRFRHILLRGPRKKKDSERKRKKTSD